jgi:hypothetical protein
MLELKEKNRIFKKIGLGKRNDKHLKKSQLVHFLKCEMNINREGE